MNELRQRMSGSLVSLAFKLSDELYVLWKIAAEFVWNAKADTWNDRFTFFYYLQEIILPKIMLWKKCYLIDNHVIIKSNRYNQFNCNRL